jgi:hypothetical protein
LRYARLCRSCLKTPVLAGQDADACQIVTSPADRIPVRDQQMGTLTWCIDQALRAVGGASAYLLTDNARTVTMDHVAGIPVRHPEMGGDPGQVVTAIRAIAGRTGKSGPNDDRFGYRRFTCPRAAPQSLASDC